MHPWTVLPGASSTQRRHQVGAHAHSGRAPEEEPAHLHALTAAAAAGHQAALSASAVTSLQRSIGNRAVARMLTGQAGSGTAPLVVQRVSADQIKQSLGGDLVSKHVGTEPMPDVSTPEGREEAAAAVYYQRPKGDRKDMNTVFFVDPTALFTDLRNHNQNQDLTSGPSYSTADSYPAITVLVVGTKNQDSSGKNVPGAVTGPFDVLKIQHGQAKPVVTLNKKDGNVLAFNHLQQTDPKVLENTVNMGGE